LKLPSHNSTMKPGACCGAGVFFGAEASIICALKFGGSVLLYVVKNVKNC